VIGVRIRLDGIGGLQGRKDSEKKQEQWMRRCQDGSNSSIVRKEEAYSYEISASMYKTTPCYDVQYYKLNNRVMET